MEEDILPEVARFGIFEVDFRVRELRKRGLKVRLHPQPFQVLAALLEHPGEVVTREELRQRIWLSDTFVDFDNGLNGAINRLREALGDSAASPRFVETIPRQGYRFIAPVAENTMPLTVDLPGAAEGQTQAASAATPTPAIFPSAKTGARPRILGTVLVVLGVSFAVVLALNFWKLRRWVPGMTPAPKIRSVAVLPLENLSADASRGYFADGMTEALITDLGKIADLRVISRTSTMRYKDMRGRSIAEISRELNVDAVVEGGVLQVGNRVRITAQLIQATPEKHLWAESYERNLQDVLELQGEVARAIANAIQVQLTQQEQARLARAQSVDPQAYEFYVKGRYFWSKRSEPFAHKSIDYFRQAIQRQPNYALAYAAMAEAYSVNLALPPEERCSKAKAAARTALQMDETLAEAHTALAQCLFWYDWDWAGSEKEFQRALELNPNYAQAHQWYGLTQSIMGRKQIWAAEVTRSHELDPLYMGGVGPTGLLIARGKQDLAIEKLREKLELEPNARQYGVLGSLYARKGMYREAIAYLQKGVSLSGGAPDALRDLGYTYGVSGEREKALEILQQLKLLSKRRYVSPYDIAVVYVGLGEKDHAFDWLQKAVADRSIMLLMDEKIDTLHRDPRYSELLRSIGLPQ